MEPAEGRQEEKKLVKRKRKLHHGPSSLLRATIQEYGVYDKQVDAFRTKFLMLFGFLEPWQNSAVNKAVSQSLLQSTGSGDVTESIGAPGVCRPLNRELCLEEELQVRLGRMTSIAKTLRNLCSKEREQKIVLYKEVCDCKDACSQLLSDMISHFHKETDILQHRLLEMDSTLEELEQEKGALKQAYEEMVGHATRTVDALEAELNQAEKCLKDTTEELQDLRSSYKTLERKSVTYKEENEELQEKVKALHAKVKGLEIKSSSSDMAREQYETLLEIALNKLRLFEEGELVARVPRGKHSTPDTTSVKSHHQGASGYTAAPSNPYDLSEMRLQEMLANHMTSTRRRFHSDNMSITSFDTVSEMSMPIMSLTDSSRYISEDRLSNHSNMSRSLVSPSPKVPPRRKHKKKQFFTKPFLRKSVSMESQLQNASSTERLPTIEDEFYERSISQNDISLSGSDNMSRATSHQALAEDNESHKEHSKFKKPSIFGSRENILKGKNKEKTITINDHRRESELSQTLSLMESPSSTGSKKVQRTSSFAGLKSKKNGLVALAKDIEKRFKKKRRSKTADFSELTRINQELPDKIDINERDMYY